MKDLKKLIVINLRVALCLLLLLEFLCYESTVIQASNYTNINSRQQKKQDRSPPISQYSIKMVPFDYQYYKKEFRKVSGENYKKKSIVIFGCSFGYGEGLKEKETLGYKLSQLTKRPVYNRAHSGWSPDYILYQLRREDFYKEVKNPEYFVYIFIGDHVRRMFQPQWYLASTVPSVRYKEKNGKFEEMNPFLYQFWGLYTVRQFQEVIEKYITMSPKNNERNFNEFVDLMKESKRLTKKAYPNSKFVILKYCDDNENYFTQKAQWKKLEDAGFTIIEVQELLGCSPRDPKYLLPDGHPSTKAWDKITPALTKKLNL